MVLSRSNDDGVLHLEDGRMGVLFCWRGRICSDVSAKMYRHHRSARGDRTQMNLGRPWLFLCCVWMDGEENCHAL
jgi:hypothetical protein